MKHILTTLVIIAAVAAIGLYALNVYIYTEKQAEDPAPEQEREVTLEGVVTEVDLEAVMVDGPARITFESQQGETHTIAVPSMGLTLCEARENIADVYDIEANDRVTVRGALNEEEQIVPCEDALHFLRITGVHTDTEIGFSFTYPKGPDGYVREGEDQQFSDDETFVAGIQLMNKKEVKELRDSTEPREGPPAISLRVYENIEDHWPLAWAEAYARESNIEIALSDPVETAVGGAKAIRYTADGLYAADTYVVTHGDHVFLLRGEYLDTDSDIYRDYQALVDSFTFTPPTEN